MGKILTLLVLSWGLAFSSELLSMLKSDADWKISGENENGYVFYSREIPGYPLHASRLDITTSLDDSLLAELIQDVRSYPDNLKSASLMKFHSLGENGNVITAYQFIAVPLIRDRHYAYEFHRNYEKKGGIREFYWELLPESSVDPDFLSEREKEYGSAVYISEGVGYFRIEDLNNGRHLLSYRIYMDTGGFLPAGLMEASNRNGLATLLDEVLAAAEQALKR